MDFNFVFARLILFSPAMPIDENKIAVHMKYRGEGINVGVFDKISIRYLLNGTNILA